MNINVHITALKQFLKSCKLHIIYELIHINMYINIILLKPNNGLDNILFRPIEDISKALDKRIIRDEPTIIGAIDINT